MEFLHVECRCTNFRQAWANKDKKLVFLSLDMIHVSNIKLIYFKHIQLSYLGFGVTVVNAYRKVRKIKVGAQIIARRWNEKAAAQTPSQKSFSWH